MLLIESMLMAGATGPVPPPPLAQTGFLYVWGAGTDNRGPAPGSTVFSWTAIESGTYGMAAIRSDGSLWTWGTGDQGQLGQGKLARVLSPVQVGSSSWTAISGGNEQFLALRQDSTLWGWGRNNRGQVGNYTNPTLSWTTISAGYYHSVGITSDGGLYAWGADGDVGRIGQGVSPINALYIVPQKIGQSSWTAVTAGKKFSVAIRQDGTMWSWGDNNGANLGLSGPGNIDISPRSSPTQIGTSSWSAVSANETFAMAIRSDGRLFTWGTNQFGQGGDPSIGGSVIGSPTQIGTSSWIAIAAGGSHAAAIRQDGGLFAWGRANVGQLGIGPGVATSWTQLLIDDSWGIGIRNDGALLSWGYSSWQGIPAGRAWSGTTSTPTLLTASGVQGSSFTAVTANVSGGAAIRQDGRLFTWGSGQFGFLGQNSTSSSYGPASLGTSSWTAVQANSWHMLAIRQDGRLFAWGRNQYGQLGDGTTINRSSPVQIGSSSWTALGQSGMRNNVSMAIRQDGGLFTWGRNFAGMLGHNDTTNRSSPVQVGTSSWTMVAHSESHTAAIRQGGSLFTWGLNATGQLGDGTTTNRSSPVGIGSSSWAVVSAGNSHTSAIRQGGSLFAWGQNNLGQLGQGGTINTSSPVQVGSSSWSAVRAGNSNNLGILNQTGFGWGFNNNGMLGLGDALSYYSPVAMFADPPANRSSPVQIGTSSWTQVSAGLSFTVAIRQGGSLFSWGSGAFGQLGLGDQTNRFSPVQVGSLSWTQIRAMANGVLGRTIGTGEAGKVYVFGRNQTGELGVGDNLDRLAPVSQGNLSYSAVGTGGASRTGFRMDSLATLQGWGLNNFRQVGQGWALTFSPNSPVLIGGSLTNALNPFQISTSSWTAISSAANHALAVRQDGALFSWGYGAQGRLGLGSTTNRSSPTQVGSSSWTAVAASYYNSQAIRQDGGLFTWGFAYSGSLGLGTYVNLSSPVQIGTSSWTAVSAKQNHTLALRQDRSLWGFGINTNGQLAYTTAAQSWTAVSMGQYFVAAISNTGGLYVWGANGQGQLGLGDQTQRSSPVQVGTSSWTAVACGRRFTLAIRQDGALFSWGDGGNGALGSGALTNRSSPVQVGSSSWTQISAGRYNSMALRQGGSLFGWGANDFGELGLGDQVAVSSPVQVGSSSWSAVAAGHRATLGLLQNNTLYAWGQNDQGQLGLNDTTNRSSPVQVGTSSWTVISAANYFSGAIRQDGRLFMWGVAASGQLGDNSFSKKSSPVQIGTSSWTQLGLARDSVQAIRSDNTLWAWGSNSYGRLGLGDTNLYASPQQVGTGTWSAVTKPNNANRNMFEITTEGLLFGQGGNTYGVIRNPNISSPVQIGNDPITPVNSPTQIGTSSWAAIRAGNSMSMAIRQDGRLFAWGSGQSGRLGLGSQTSVFSPTQVGTSSWTTLGSLVNGAGILSNGIAYVWGQNASGQLGNNGTGAQFSPNLLGNTPLNSSSPTVLGSTSWRWLAMADSHSAAISSDYKLFTWGTNDKGQLGLGDAQSRSQPTQVGTSSWIAVDCGSYGDSKFMLALRADGTLWSWGRGYQGQLGLNESEGGTAKSSPVPVGSSSWTAVAAGKQSYAIRQDGGLFAWGPGPLGLGDYSLYLSPVQVGTSSWTTVSAGDKAGMAIRRDGRLFGWGYNQFGQLGDGFTSTRVDPTEISGGGSWTAVSMSKSGNHAIGIKITGLVYAWGRNQYGQLGMGNTTNVFYPVYQFGLTGSWTAVNAGNNWAAAVGQAGQLWVWGRNNYGQLGDGTTINRSLPVQVGSATNWVNNSTRVIAGTTNIGGAFRQT